MLHGHNFVQQNWHELHDGDEPHVDADQGRCGLTSLVNMDVFDDGDTQSVVGFCFFHFGSRCIKLCCGHLVFYFQESWKGTCERFDIKREIIFDFNQLRPLPIVIIFIFLSVFFGLTYEVLHGAHPRPVSAS